MNLYLIQWLIKDTFTLMFALSVVNEFNGVFGRGEIEAREKATREIAKKHGTSSVWFSAENEESDKIRMGPTQI